MKSAMAAGRRSHPVAGCIVARFIAQGAVENEYFRAIVERRQIGPRREFQQADEFLVFGASVKRQNVDGRRCLGRPDRGCRVDGDARAVTTILA